MDYQVAIEEMDRLHTYLSERSDKLTAMVKKANVAETMKTYRKAMGIATLKLKKDTSVGLIKDLARSMCADEEYDMVQAEMEYKTCKDLIDCAKAQLNALQSQTRIKE